MFRYVICISLMSHGLLRYSIFFSSLARQLIYYIILYIYMITALIACRINIGISTYYIYIYIYIITVAALITCRILPNSYGNTVETLQTPTIN